MARTPAGLFYLTVILGWSAAMAQAAVTIDWVTVGDPGNTCDPQATGCFGAVPDVYRISKYETTNAQYAEFLNAVAATDTYGLYYIGMGSFPYGGIARSGDPGSYTYDVIAGRGDMPVNYVSFYDGLRFANWLHNGQPTGAQDDTTTEDGAYTITQAGVDDNSITRNAGATIFIPGQDEWYKAAYYDASSTSYFDYPAGSDTPTTCAAPGATSNTANCDWVAGDLTDVGSYAGSASPNGTFDQGGNVSEWNEAIVGPSRGQRGGSLSYPPNYLAASYRYASNPSYEDYFIGVRVASPRPAPAVPSLSPVGTLVVGSLLALTARRSLPTRNAGT